jgi:hypothetical protein
MGGDASALARRTAAAGQFELLLMLVVVAVQAQQFPVAAVGGLW